ncbi:hypothetical protein [Nocardia carnea]|uniref:hypothetical protein n=1 Tax=Nocardia carnea TaxID=37328 RepID=UPI00245604B4|nr:hypothetical protein [Nocardia carnea]
MAAVPPVHNSPLSPGNHPVWALIGPALATIVGLSLVTGVYRLDGVSHLQVELGLSNGGFLLTGVVAYVVAAALAFPLGFVLAPRSLTAVIVPAIGVMFLGVLIVAFGGGPATLLIGRVLGGLGAGAAVGTTVALLRPLDGNRRIAALAVAAVGAVALVIAPLVNQVVSEALSFRLAYAIALPFLFAALLAATITGIVLAVTRRPTPPPGYGMPNPTQQFHH